MVLVKELTTCACILQIGAKKKKDTSKEVNPVREQRSRTGAVTEAAEGTPGESGQNPTCGRKRGPCEGREPTGSQESQSRSCYPIALSWRVGYLNLQNQNIPSDEPAEDVTPYNRRLKGKDVVRPSGVDVTAGTPLTRKAWQGIFWSKISRMIMYSSLCSLVIFPTPITNFSCI